jgi:hypothetical protein
MSPSIAKNGGEAAEFRPNGEQVETGIGIRLHCRGLEASGLIQALQNVETK